MHVFLNISFDKYIIIQHYIPTSFSIIINTWFILRWKNTQPTTWYSAILLVWKNCKMHIINIWLKKWYTFNSCRLLAQYGLVLRPLDAKVYNVLCNFLRSSLSYHNFSKSSTIVYGYISSVLRHKLPNLCTWLQTLWL